MLQKLGVGNVSPNWDNEQSAKDVRGMKPLKAMSR